MAMCEDFPCCGHELGCCPRFSESGEQLDMVCTCGARLPVTNRYSICDGCLRMGQDDHEVEFADDRDEDGCYDEDRDDYDDHDCYEDEVDGPEDEFLDSEWEDRLGGMFE